MSCHMTRASSGQTRLPGNQRWPGCSASTMFSISRRSDSSLCPMMRCGRFQSCTRKDAIRLLYSAMQRPPMRRPGNKLLLKPAFKISTPPEILPIYAKSQTTLQHVVVLLSRAQKTEYAVRVAHSPSAAAHCHSNLSARNGWSKASFCEQILVQRLR